VDEEAKEEKRMKEEARVATIERMGPIRQVHAEEHVANEARGGHMEAGGSGAHRS
jgi:hypothetical protein